MTRSRGIRPRYTEPELLEVAARLARRESLTRIAADSGRDRGALRQALRARGLPSAATNPPTGRPPVVTEEQIAEATERLAKGHQLGDIAYGMGMDRTTLLGALKRRGLPTRPPELTYHRRKGVEPGTVLTIARGQPVPRAAEAGATTPARTVALSRDEVKARILRNVRADRRPQMRVVS